MHASVFVKGTKRIIFDIIECCVPESSPGARFGPRAAIWGTSSVSFEAKAYFFKLYIFSTWGTAIDIRFQKAQCFAWLRGKWEFWCMRFRHQKKIFFKPDAPHQRGISYPLRIRELYFDIHLFSLCWQLTWATSMWLLSFSLLGDAIRLLSPWQHHEILSYLLWLSSVLRGCLSGCLANPGLSAILKPSSHLMN